MIAIGIDPGPEKTGFAVLNVSGRAALLVESGHWTKDTVRALVRHHLHENCVIGVETPTALHPDPNQARLIARARGLLPTALLAGRYLEIAEALSANTYGVSPSDWMLAITGKRSPTDAERARVIRLRVALWPKLRANGNTSHAVDAAGVALWAAQTARMKARRVTA